jgi:hypothetical protein
MTKAHGLLNEAVTLARVFNYQEEVASFEPYLGLVTLYRGDVREARRLLADSLRLCRELNDRYCLGLVCAYLAETALCDRELDEAESWLAHSLTYEAAPGYHGIDRIERLIVAARLATAQGIYQRAATLLGAAEAAWSRIRYRPVGPARALADASLATTRSALGPALFAEAFAAGQQLSLDEAFATTSNSPAGPEAIRAGDA